MGARLPVRTCVGCREPAPKADLVRIVRGPTGIAVGARGNGRGAYVHPRRACLEAGIRTETLSRALRAGVTDDELGRLRADLRTEMTKL